MNGRIKMGAIEMYESPISIEHVPAKTVWADFTDAMANAGAKKLDEMILKAVGEVKVNVDPDELEKALQYDRDQFQKGFAAGVEWAGAKWASVKRSAVFSERKSLEREFLEWAKEKQLGICPFNVVTWLLCIKGYEPPKEE